MVEYKKYNEIVLSELLSDYRKNFAGKTILMRSNYKYLQEFKVMFHDDNLPHLLGLHYVSQIKYATGILKNIESGKMTEKTIQRHPEFNARDLKGRITAYPLLYDIFHDNKVQVLIPTENMKPNSMRLECVFTSENEKGEYVLGLRKDKIDGIYKPTTLYFSRKKRFSNMRKSTITYREWQ